MLRCCLIGLLLHIATRQLCADEFTIRLDGGDEATVTARHAGSGRDAVALEFPDGHWDLIPADRITSRKAGTDPTPLTHEEVRDALITEFGEERTLVELEKPYVIVLIRSGTTTRDAATLPQLKGVVRKAGTFFKGMQQNFLDFVKAARVEITPLKFPLAALIFESDRQFDAYAAVATGQEGLSVQNIAAFYDLLSNRLVIRLRECASFDTPLHEAVHQQVYNRGVLQRLAPVPAWFNEGLATGFEGDGERVRSGPKAISERYGALALRARVIDWRDVVANDQPFQGDVLAAEAYGHAWGLHWLLVTRYRTEYNRLVRHYSVKKPLEDDHPQQRVAEFERLIGKSVPELQQEFRRELPRAVAKRKN